MGKMQEQGILIGFESCKLLHQIKGILLEVPAIYRYLGGILREAEILCFSDAARIQDSTFPQDFLAPKP